MNKNYEAIAIGVSAGGMEALGIIIPELPMNFRLPVIIVQHREKNSNGFLSDYLDHLGDISVKEILAGESIKPGIVYIAPAGYHLLIEEDKTFTFSLEPPVNFSRPSIDVLFESAAYVYENRLIGVVLTGANTDGSQGIKIIKEWGGLSIVQDPLTARFDQMPLSAIGATQIDHILGIKEIGPFLRTFHGQQGIVPPSWEKR